MTEEKEIQYHIDQYEIYDYRLYHIVNGHHLYDSKDEKQRLLDMQEHHALQYLELTSNNNLLMQIDNIQQKGAEDAADEDPGYDFLTNT